MSKGLSNTGRLALNTMFAQMATTYGVPSVNTQFAVDPSINQTLQDAIVESSEFLKMINTVGVDELQGEKVMGGAAGGPGRRTNTDLPDNPRVPQDLLTMGSKKYQLSPTEHDFLIKYTMLDSWAKFPELYRKYGDYVRQQIAISRIMVGWNGLSAELETDPVLFPLGEDLNIGWLQILRDYQGGSQVLEDGATTGVIQLGAGGDYENLDSLVLAAHSLLNPIYQGATDLVVMIGRELTTADKAQIYAAQGQKPTEKSASKIEQITSEYAGLPLATLPAHFPSRAVLVTSHSNLSIYHQSDSWRRQIKDNPEYNRVDEFNSVNEGYVVEDEEKAAFVEFSSIVLPDGSGGWA